MRAAAQLHRIWLSARGEVVSHGKHADLVAVFLAKHRDGSGFDCLYRRHKPRQNVIILADDLIDLIFDTLELLVSHRAGMGKIET